MYLGECPVTYEVVKDSENFEENYRIIKNYSTDECSEFKHKAYLNPKASKVRVNDY